MQQPARAPQAQATIRVPETRAELEALHAQRNELRAQLESVTHRRGEVSEQAQRTDEPALRGELQARIKALDVRIGQLEQQILQADVAISEALARGIATEQHVTVPTIPPIPPIPAFPQLFGVRQGVDRDVFAATIAGMTLLFALIGVFIHRRAWRRAEKKFSVVSGNPAQIQQLQQAVDVIAVEVERISEGQRYVSKLLNDRAPRDAERVVVGPTGPDAARNR